MLKNVFSVLVWDDKLRAVEQRGQKSRQRCHRVKQHHASFVDPVWNGRVRERRKSRKQGNGQRSRWVIAERASHIISLRFHFDGNMTIGSIKLANNITFLALVLTEHYVRQNQRNNSTNSNAQITPKLI